MLVDEVEVDVDELVEVDVVVVVVSHPAQVLSHCFSMEADNEQRPAAKNRSHVAWGNSFRLFAH